MAEFEGRAREIIAEGANHVVLSVPRKDGTVQSVVIWANVIDGAIAVNSAEGRAWPANLRRAGTATITAYADEHINELSHKYMGTDYQFFQEGETRVKFTLVPERVTYVKD